MALTTQQIQKAYIAFFNRPADVSGLKNWQAYTGDDADLLTTFAASTEYTDLFNNKSHEAIVETVYHNLFARSPDSAGLQNWVSNLKAGAISIGNLAYTMLNSAGPGDIDTIAAKLLAAESLTNYLATHPESSRGYEHGGASAGATVREWFAKIGESGSGKQDALNTIGATGNALAALPDVVHVHVTTPVGAGLGTAGAGSATGTGSGGAELSIGAKSILGIWDANAGDSSTRWNFGEVVGGSNLSAGIGTGVTLTYSFLFSLPNYYYSSLEYSQRMNYSMLQTFTTIQKTVTKQILAQISEVTNVTFKEVSFEGDITFAKSTQQSTTVTGHTYLQSFSWWTTTQGVVSRGTTNRVGGDVWLAKDDLWSQLAGTPWQEGGYGFGTLFHEIGHALGLTHPFSASAQGGVTLANNDPLNDTRHTIMAYNDAKDSHVLAGGTTYYPLQPDSLMPFDIEALQYLYGAKASATGDNTYAWGDKPEILQTIWDAGGIDTIDASNQTGNCVINLNAGTYSSIGLRGTAIQGGYTGKDNLAIAKNVVIENAKGGSGNDLLLGNAANNRLEGGLGDDLYAGYKIGVSSGHDTLCDTGGNDRVEITNAKKDAGLADVAISHSGGNLVLTLSSGSSVTLVDFYVGSNAIEPLAGTDWNINLVGVANQLANGEYTTLGDIFA